MKLIIKEFFKFLFLNIILFTLLYLIRPFHTDYNFVLGFLLSYFSLNYWSRYFKNKDYE